MCNHQSNSYHSYKHIKNKLSSISYKGVDVDKLSAFNVAIFYFLFPRLNLWGRMKYLINFLFFIPNVDLSRSEKEAIFGWSIKRKDYEVLSDAYKKKIGLDFQCLGLSFLSSGKRFRFDCFAFFYSLIEVKKIKDLTIKEMGICFFSLYKSISFFNFLEANLSLKGTKLYLSFNSSFDYESVFTLFLRLKGVKTLSMQHGMYFDYCNEKPFDIINYENVTAHKLLVWGEFTKEQVDKYLPVDCECEVFGNPLYIHSENFHNFESKKFLVGLPRATYESEVVSLLNILSGESLSGYDFYIRPHPDFNKKIIDDFVCAHDNFYLSSCPELKVDISTSEYFGFVGFNSTVLFEAVFLGLPVYQFLSGKDEFVNVGFYEFDNVESFINKTDEIPMNSVSLSKKQFYFNTDEVIGL